MIELTVGYVAGIIALGIVAAQLWCPTALTFILAGQLRSTESATTWTTAGRYLQSSLWPLLLRSDSTKNKSMPKLVVLTTFFIPVLTILIAIAGIVTPLGLYEENALASESEVVDFAYVPDSSHFFQGTSPRENQPFTRRCRYTVDRLIFGAPGPCPYTNDTLIWETDGMSFNATTPKGTNVTVPNIVKDIYSSGTSIMRTTVSNFFDIQWRQLTTQFFKDVDNGTRITVGQYSLMDSFILDDAYRVIEGLIVNAKTGGVGFRNHTLPVGRPRGATWYEDLLFIEPESQCEALNLTVDFGVSTSVGVASETKIVNLTLTDRGGFANLNTTIPLNDTLNESNTPDLRVRAHSTAWLLTAYSMFLLNVTNPRRGSQKPYQYINSEIGKQFKLPSSTTDMYKYLGFFAGFGDLFDLSIAGDDLIYDNPWNITTDEFESIQNLCQDTWAYDHARPNTTFVACNFVRGTPKRVDRPGVIFQDGSRWSSPLYACASAVKATVKTVKFFHNGTATDLSNLVVQEIKDKQYKSEEDMPIWGFEDWFYRLHEFQPVWGLVNAAYEGFRNVTTLRSPSFYMLGSANNFGGPMLSSLSPMMNLPGAIGPIGALGSVTSSTAVTADASNLFGGSNLGTWLRWQNLTSTAETMPMVFKLLWTDVAASAMVGTKGILGSGNAQADEAMRVSIIPTVRKIRYKYMFGIPAFLVAVCVIICSVLAIGSLLFGHSNFSTVSQRLKQTSVGRALTTAFYPEASSFSMTPAEWVASHGSKKLDLAGYAAPASEPPPLPSRPGTNNGRSEKYNSQYSAVPLSPPSPYQ